MICIEWLDESKKCLFYLNVECFSRTKSLAPMFRLDNEPVYVGF